MTDLLLTPNNQQEFLAELRSHGRALAVELSDLNIGPTHVIGYRGRYPKPGWLNRLFGITQTRKAFAWVWPGEGELLTKTIKALFLAQDGTIYVSPMRRTVNHERLDERHVVSMHDAQAVRKWLHLLEERHDVFNKLRGKAES